MLTSAGQNALKCIGFNVKLQNFYECNAPEGALKTREWKMQEWKMQE